MCGHITIFSKQDPISVDLLKLGMAQLHHRGPDSQLHWVGAQSKIGMGHTRLSIIDLSTGDQPLHSNDQQIHAVVNGEFYGYEPIRESLIERGHHFRTQSDSEILLYLYREQGTNCLSQLRGEFAFTLWDSANETLFAARDRFGIKPLFYATHGDKLYIASEIKALLAAGVPAHWDDESVYQLHDSMMLHPTRTLFQNVFQVPPGHFLLASRHQLQIIKYWDFNYPSAEFFTSQKRPESECLEELKSALHESVKLRLRADVPVGCYLSGGLDSCSVLGIASLYSQQPIQAFTLSFDQPEYDEEALARDMASHAGARYTPISVRSQDLVDHFSDAVWHAETAFINSHGIAKFILSEAVRRAGHKVVLTGEGSDEIFAGYPHFRRDYFLHQKSSQGSAQVGELLKDLQQKNQVSKGLLLPEEGEFQIPSLKQALGFMPSFLLNNAQFGVSFKKLLTEDFLAPFEMRDSHRTFLNEIDIHSQLSGRDSVHQSLYLWSKILLPNYILSVLGDRMEMGHSIEGRVPFLDHHLVEKVVKMPVNLKIKGSTEKYLLREAARPVLTDTIYQRQKHPFLAPPVTTQSGGALFDWMQDTLRSSQADKVPFYSKSKVIGLLDQLKDSDSSTRAALDPILMVVLSLTVLHSRFKL
jgi:asparagine synthase (glutamine-hydrolysing)